MTKSLTIATGTPREKAKKRDYNEFNYKFILKTINLQWKEDYNGIVLPAQFSSHWKLHNSFLGIIVDNTFTWYHDKIY